MLRFLVDHARGAAMLLIYVINTLFWALPLLLVALCKLLIPIPAWRRATDSILNGLANNWICCNNWSMRVGCRTQWDVRGIDALKLNGWYLVVANHQSWVDILVLQRVFYRKIPFLKFFLKRELIWVPVLGLVWWALDYPFMKRYSKATLEKYPHLKGHDLEITRKACEKFRTTPVSIMNFVEGTRYTFSKHHRQQSPYDHLLNPKAGGVAFVLAAMGEHLHRILNVTIAYPQGPKSFWAFLCGKIEETKVRVESLPIPSELLGDYFEDMEFRERFQQWLNLLWLEKDRRLTVLLDPSRALPEVATLQE
jgi:1-acyl-sn-glycerol-3-phosphate acyltransferase